MAALENIGKYNEKVMTALNKIANDNNEMEYNLCLMSKLDFNGVEEGKIYLNSEGNYCFIHSITEKLCKGKIKFQSRNNIFQNLEAKLNDEELRSKIINMLSRKYTSIEIKQVAINVLDCLRNIESHDDFCENYIPDYDHDDDDDDDYPMLTSSEKWLLELDFAQVEFDDYGNGVFVNSNNEQENDVISISIKGYPSSTIYRSKYDEFLMRRTNEESLSVSRLVMLDSNYLKYFLEKGMFLPNTSLADMIRAYAICEHMPQNKWFERLIAKRIFYAGITIIIVSEGIVVYEAEKVIFLKANDHYKLNLINFHNKFYRLLCTIAKEIEFPINYFESVGEELCPPQEAIEEELFVEDVQIKELKNLNEEKLSLEFISNLGAKKLKFLFENELYLLNTPLDVLIEAYAYFGNKPENEEMGELIAKRIFYCGSILIKLHNGFSIDDGSKSITITYKSYWANFTEKFLSLLCKLSINNEFPKISNDEGGNTYGHINAIYHNFIMNNFLPVDAQDLCWMKKIYDEQKQKEEDAFRVETTKPKTGCIVKF